MLVRQSAYAVGAAEVIRFIVGSMDSSISIWATHSKTPLAVFRHFFAQAVLDMSWTPDGLFVGSICAVVVFAY